MSAQGNFSETIIQARLAKRWGQTTLAREAGVARATITLWEKGGVRKALPDTIRRVAAALDLDPDELIRKQLEEFVMSLTPQPRRNMAPREWLTSEVNQQLGMLNALLGDHLDAVESDVEAGRLDQAVIRRLKRLHKHHGLAAHIDAVVAWLEEAEDEEPDGPPQRQDVL